MSVIGGQERPFIEGDFGEILRAPFPGSRKVYVEGSQPTIRVPMREIVPDASPITGLPGRTLPPPITVYDTSGPYTDPACAVDVREGLTPIRSSWITARGDTAPHPEKAAVDEEKPSPAAKGLPAIHTRLRARPGTCVTQMHYARRGVVTP